MKKLSNDNGFTIIEILVAINLSFVIIGLLFTFYLFTIKFVSTNNKKVEEKHFVNNVLFKVNETLKKSETFEFIFIDEHKYFTTNKNDTIIFFKDSIDVNKVYSLNELDSLNLEINLFEGNNYIYSNGHELFFDRSAEGVIQSSLIDNIKLSFIYKNQKYFFDYVNSQNSSKRFNNTYKE
ncbi:MAG: type II secretion system protein [Ignavibacteria bacterium]|jgi:hypothetical protein